jgi:NADH-quinone oxidoreductase subunit G
MSAPTGLVNLTIDGHAVSVPKGTTVYAAARKLGIEIPIFCYLDRMPPFGACRMCLVEVEKMPKLQTACTLEVNEGMVVKTQTAIVAEGRKEILEFLLINHPLDCPVCDKGGECPLQDNTMKYGPGMSQFFEKKRQFKKPLPLSPVLMLDRERCILCARCTRFGEHLAGDHALVLLNRGFRSEVGTQDGEVAESKFIGNTIMICPVGALTSRVYRFRARPWDNRPTKSTCTLCPVGCSLYLDSRDGQIMRTRSHENKDVNDIWLCDKGWFGYEFTAHVDRLQTPLIRRSGTLEPASWEEALSLIAQKIRAAKAKGKLAALGGNPLTVEENYLFQKLMREGAGVNHVDHRVGMPILSLEEEGIMAGMEISIGDCEDLSFAVLLGLDLTEEFPVIWLRLRQAINRGAKVIFIGHFTPEIAPYLAQVIVHAPGEELDALKRHLPELSSLAETGGKGALFVGSQYLASPQRRAILAELMQVRQSSPHLSLNLLEGRGNSIGARLAGMRPDLGPLGKPLSQPGLNAVQVVEEAACRGWDFLYVAGANPAQKFPAKLWEAARQKLGFLVVQDLFLTETASQADVVLPTLCYVEKGGSFVNIGGRVQELWPGKDIPVGVYSDAEIFLLLAQKLTLTLEIDQAFWEKLKPGRLPVGWTEKTSLSVSSEQRQQIPEGRLAATFAYALFDQGIRMQHDPHVYALVKEPAVRLHPVEGTKRGIQEGDIISIKAKEDSITAKVKLDPGVAEGTIVLPLGFEDVPVHNLGVNLLNGLAIEIKKEVSPC